MNIKELIEEGLGFESGSTNQKYKTDLTGKVREIKKDTLSDEVVSSFLNGEYKTYITIDEIILYRTYGEDTAKIKVQFGMAVMHQLNLQNQGLM